MGIEFYPDPIYKIEVHIPESHDRKEHIRTFRIGMPMTVGNSSIQGKIVSISDSTDRPGFFDVFVEENVTKVIHKQEQFNARYVIRVGFKSNIYDTTED